MERGCGPAVVSRKAEVMLGESMFNDSERAQGSRDPSCSICAGSFMGDAFALDLRRLLEAHKEEGWKLPRRKSSSVCRGLSRSAIIFKSLFYIEGCHLLLWATRWRRTTLNQLIEMHMALTNNAPGSALAGFPRPKANVSRPVWATRRTSPELHGQHAHVTSGQCTRIASARAPRGVSKPPRRHDFAWEQAMNR